MHKTVKTAVYMCCMATIHEGTHVYYRDASWVSFRDAGRHNKPVHVNV